MPVMKEIYFDNASTTKVRQEVIDEMLPYMDQFYGNPSGLNKYSRDAKKALEKARETFAELIGAEPAEIFFTSGGTESNNLAVQGFIRARNNKNDHIISSRIEHPSVIQPCQQLEREDRDYNMLDVDSEGNVLLDDFNLLLKPSTVFVSVMHANNEIGTIQPVSEISEIIKKRNIVFHTDAVQTLGKMPFNVNHTGVDLASFSAHKIHGPKGIGALYVNRDIKLRPVIFGGGQENGLRSGTVPVPLIVGFSKALELAVSEMQDTQKKLYEMMAKINESLKNIDGIKLNGPADIYSRLPGNLNYSFDTLSGDSLMLHLGLKNISVSSGSACSSEKLRVSRVLRAIGIKPAENFASIRISLDRENTPEECEYFTQNLLSIVENLCMKSNQKS